MSVGFDDTMLQRIDDGTASVHFAGYIKYRGVHTLGEERHYVTTFHFKWIDMAGRIPGLDSYTYWEECGGEQENLRT
jgi:hypothetical protein